MGPSQFIADQLLAKVGVIRAVHERVQLCQDPQTEFALLRQSLGVSRVNPILWVHGHTILQEKRAAKIYDEVGQRSLERLFPAFTEDSTEQATVGEEKATAKLYIQKAAKAADEAWLQTVEGHNGPTVTNATVSQDVRD